MSATDSAFGLIKDVLLFRESIAGVRTNLAELARKLEALTDDHVVLSNRVARIEGMIEGANMVAPRARRLPRPGA